MDKILSVKNLTVRFGGLYACRDIAFSIERGSVFALIGPNGAGKTSLVNALTGVYRTENGATAVYRDRNGKQHELIGRRPDQIVRLGVVRSFQNLGLFRHMTTVDNLLLGRYVHQRTGMVAAALRLPRVVREEIRQRAVIDEIIDLLRVREYRDEPVGSLPYGVQKRIELGRLLAMEPDLLLLDEPMAGMTIDEKKEMLTFVLRARRLLDMTIMLIEHDMPVVMSVADHVLAVSSGEWLAEGTPSQIQSNKAVIEAYLGTDS
jgi:ABC-type branched-chain amino acid transport systems, ATPase component